jgi:hypothetical protein
VNKFLSSLTPSQKRIFYVTVFVVILALFDRLLVGPTMTKLGAIDESIQSEENSIKGDLRFLSYKDRINKEAKAYDAYYAQGTPREDEVMAAFLDKLDKLVNQSGLTLQKNNRSNDQKDPSKESKDYLSYRADVEASGSLDGVAKLMYAISTSPDLLKILKMNLAMKKNGDVEEIKVTMTVAKYIITTSAPSSDTAPSTVKPSAKSAK